MPAHHGVEMKEKAETFNEFIGEIEGKPRDLRHPEVKHPDGDGDTDDEERMTLSPTALFFLSR